MILPMDASNDELRTVMSQIDDLLEESYALKRTRESWSRHVEIQAEIMRLCRLAADMHTRPNPYWIDDEQDSPSDDENSRAA